MTQPLKKGFLIRDGFSQSAWKSLAIKSLRLGWPEGLSQASGRLSRTQVRALLTCCVFEDLFPAWSQLSEVMAYVEAGAFLDLCAQATHHGRGYTDAFCDLEAESVAKAQETPQAIQADAQALGISLPNRALNCFYTWLKLQPLSPAPPRTLDTTPWTGMPAFALDGHTLEGRRAGTLVTFLSGTYEQHRIIARRVHSVGWAQIRDEIHAQVLSL